MNQAKIKEEQPIRKAFEVLPPWCEWGQAMPSIEYGASVTEVKGGEIEGTKVRRCPEEDLFAPAPDGCLEEVSPRQQELLAHANGNDTIGYGFLNYSCAPKDDPDHLALVAKGLITGPLYIKGALPHDHAYFYLTKQGWKAARTLRPRRRGHFNRILNDGGDAMSEMRELVKGALARGKEAERDEDGDFIDRDLSREFGYALNLYMSDKGYAASAFSWPLNPETREYFELWREFFGEYPEAALHVLKKDQE